MSLKGCQVVHIVLTLLFFMNVALKNHLCLFSVIFALVELKRVIFTSVDILCIKIINELVNVEDG